MSQESLTGVFKNEGVRLARNLVAALSPKLEAHARELFAQAELAFTKNLSSRVEDDLLRFSRIKTLFSEGKLVDFDEIYVKQRIKFGSSSIREDEFWPRLVKERRCIATGTAGTGKSLLARQAFRYLATQHSGVYPIFIELRSLNTSSFISLIDFVAASLSTNLFRLNADHVRICLEDGTIALILDGFDEINPELHNKYDMEIQEISRKHKKCIIFVTGRSEASRYRSWPDFNEIAVLPLTPEQTIELIGKLDEEEKVKDKFVKAAKKTLFKSHGTFLEIPLLACMMLITFKRIAEIPTRRHIFYRESFAALFDRHDASKGGQYVRRRHTSLDIDSFAKVLSCFGFLTYIDGVSSVDHDSAIKYIREASEMAELEVDADSYLKDLVGSVCLLRMEQDEIVFAHRSFQEYFCALFIANNRGECQTEILEGIADLEGDVLGLVMGINQDVLEKDWVLPVCDRIVAEFPSLTSANLEPFLKRCGSSLVVLRSTFGIGGLSSFGGGLLHLRNLYPDKFPQPRKRSASGDAARVFEHLLETGFLRFSHVSRTDSGNQFRLGELEAWASGTMKGVEAVRKSLAERFRKKDRNLRELLRRRSR